jgi:hypothetical protein
MVSETRTDQLLVTEIDYLRRLARMSRMDMITIEPVVTRMGLKKATLQKIEEQQLRWYRLVMRMECCKIASRVADWNPQGTSRRDGPLNTRKDGIKNNMQS